MIKRQLLKYFILIKEFGFNTAFNEFFLRIIGRIFGRNTIFWKKLSAHKYISINKKFKIEFHDLIEKFSCRDDSGKIGDTAVIWIFWAQGFDTAPSIVKLCVDSIQKNSNGHPVVLVDNTNLSEYVQLDANILKKYKKGINGGGG